MKNKSVASYKINDVTGGREKKKKKMKKMCPIEDSVCFNEWKKEAKELGWGLVQDQEEAGWSSLTSSYHLYDRAVT